MKIDDKTIKQLEDIIKPDTFITLTVRQSIYLPDGTVLAGTPEVYDRVARSTLSAINRKTHRKRQWKRRRRRRAIIPNVTVVERSPGGLWHIHSCLRRPSGVTITQFQQIVEDSWKQSRWYMPRWEAVEIQGEAFRYIMKDGQDSILLGASSFH